MAGIPLKARLLIRTGGRRGLLDGVNYCEQLNHLTARPGLPSCTKFGLNRLRLGPLAMAARFSGRLNWAGTRLGATPRWRWGFRVLAGQV